MNFCLGVLWLGNTVIQGSADVINHLQKTGKRVFYITNNSSKTREDFVSTCSGHDYPASKVSVSLFTLILIIQARFHCNKAVIFSFIYDCISCYQYVWSIFTALFMSLVLSVCNVLFTGQHPMYSLSNCLLLTRCRFQEEGLCGWIKGNYWWTWCSWYQTSWCWGMY